MCVTLCVCFSVEGLEEPGSGEDEHCELSSCYYRPH